MNTERVCTLNSRRTLASGARSDALPQTSTVVFPEAKDVRTTVLVKGRPRSSLDVAVVHRMYVEVRTDAASGNERLLISCVTPYTVRSPALVTGIRVASILGVAACLLSDAQCDVLSGHGLAQLAAKTI